MENDLYIASAILRAIGLVFIIITLAQQVRLLQIGGPLQWLRWSIFAATVAVVLSNPGAFYVYFAKIGNVPISDTLLAWLTLLGAVSMVAVGALLSLIYYKRDR